MSAAIESVDNEVLTTRMGVMTHLAPRSSLSNAGTLADLTTEANICLDRGDTQLVIDLGLVQTLNSVTLEAFADLQDQCKRLGGWLKLTNVSLLAQDVIHISGMSGYLPIMDIAVEPYQPPAGPPRKLGDILIAKGLLTEERISEALEIQQKSSRRLGRILVEKNWVAENEVLQALGEQLSVPYVRLRTGIFDLDIVRLLDSATARRLKLLPLQRVRGEMAVATMDPQAIPAFDELERKLDCRVRPVLADSEAILTSINDAYDINAENIGLVGDLDDDFEVVDSQITDDYAAIDEMAEGSPVINLVNSIVQRAVHDGASDVHIEPSRNRSRVRLRIDGLLYEVTTLRPELHPALVSRLKVMANLDIAERRMPQDGRIQVHTRGRAVDLRFSSLPGLYGEKIVLRVLDKNHELLDVNKLGMSDNNLETFKGLLGNSNGLILVTGPTGSGKTTSLYAALNQLNSMEKNLVTIEDPVEYQIDTVNQNEVHEKIGLSFSSILRHTLRQDPDIIMVGEIRDRETAQIAVQASLTGHLVLSTLHTNHAIGAITRMIDMGVEPYLLSSALIGVVGQRLVRSICPSCRTEYVAPPELVQHCGWSTEEPIRLARGRGCSDCYDSGYKGRIGIHEVLKTDDELQELITTNPTREQLSRYLEEHEIVTLYQDGLDQVRRSSTTIEEISRVINV